MKKKFILPFVIFAILALKQIIALPGIIKMIVMPTMSPLFLIGNFVSLIGSLFPIAMAVILLLAGMENTADHTRVQLKKITSIVCFVAAGCTFYGLLMGLLSLDMGYLSDIYSLVMYSPVISMLISVFVGILLLMCGCYIQKSVNKIPGAYKTIFIVGMAVVVFCSLLIAVAGGAGILRYIWTILEMIGIWLLPMLFVDAENEAAVKKQSKNIIIVIVIIMIVAWAISGGANGCSCGGSSRNPYDDVFSKDPNDWTEEDEQYVNDLFEWIDENQED